MQNQDPTADTDPNEYINQLVQVNSLEQLIDINQNLTTALGTSTTGSSTDPSPKIASAASPSTAKNNAFAAPATSSAQGANAQTSAPAAPTNSANAASEIHRFAGNLSVPAAQPASQRVAHALDGQSRSRTIAGGPAGAQ